MRRFSKTILSLLTVVLAVTAWGAAQNAQKAAAQADEKLVFTGAIPTNGSVVTELSSVTLNFEHDFDFNGIDGESQFGVVLDANGAEVARVFGTGDIPWEPTLTPKITPAITTPGTYTVKINAGIFVWMDPVSYDTNPDIVNEAVTLNYTIAGGDVKEPVKLIGQSPKAGEAVAELQTIELQFNQPLMLNNKIEGYWELWNADDMAAPVVTTGIAALKSGDETTVVITLNEAVSTSGNYELTAPEGLIFAKGDTENMAYVETTYYTVAAGIGGGEDEKGTLTFTNTNPAQGDVEGEKFTESPSLPINFAEIDVNKGIKATAVGDHLTMMKNGEFYADLYLNTGMMNFGAIMLLLPDGFADKMESGVYTINIPAGFFTYNNMTNEELNLSWTFTKKAPEIPDTPDYQLALKKVVLTTEDGTELNLMDSNTEVASIGKGNTLTVSTTDDQTVQFLRIDVYHFEVNSNGTEEKVIDKPIEIYGYVRDYLPAAQGVAQRNAAGEFEAELSGAASELYKGTDYYIEITASNIEGTGRPDYVSFGTQTLQFQGGSVPFEYSDVDVLSVYPEPGSEIMDDNFEFIVTFSAPVNLVDNLTFQNEGQGMTSGFAEITPNADKTVYTFKPTAYFLNGGGNVFAFGAVDMKGRPVAALGATKIKWNTCMQLEYSNNLTNLLFPVTPDGGVVEEIYNFTVTRPEGDSRTLGMTTNNLYRPYLETSTGAFICYADIEDKILYHADGSVVGDDEAEPNVAKIDFHLEQKITAPGKYVFVVPSGSFIVGQQFDTDGNKPMRYSFTIEGTPEVASMTVTNGAALSELGLVGFIFNNEVEFAGRGQNIALRMDGDSYMNAPAVIYQQNGQYVVAANFIENGAPVQLQPGSEYELRIPAGNLQVPDATDPMPFGLISVKFTGVGAAPEYVALTENIAGQAATVAKVAKGETATVDFTPAEGWKVETVTLNGAAVSVSGNSYTTPALEADATLAVTFAYDGTVFEPAGMDEVFGDFQLRAWSENGVMTVAGLKAGMTVDVYAVNGTHVGSYAIESDDNLKISVAAGTYVITVAKDGKREAIKLQNK